MTTLNPLELGELGSLPHLPRDAGGPVFGEPWQATAFALTVQLSAEGYFTWTEWVAALTDELKDTAERGEPDNGSRYYEHWLAALERLVVAKGLSDPTALLACKEAWADAYGDTPHGQPVILRNAISPQTRV
jgi:nitrile hydratase accessory protein